ncbi:hypothetical protein L0Y69_00135 [bacterium]|nr:hypothetical protein [bacterium]
MVTNITMGKINVGNIGKLPVVVLPLEEYQDMLEDLEMRSSTVFRKKIAAARKEKKLHSSKETRKLLGI